MKRGVVVWPVVTIVAVLTLGCSGNTTATTSPSTSSGTATTSSSATVGGTTPSGTTVGGTAVVAGDFCARIKEADAKTTESDDSNGGSTMGGPTPEEVETFTGALASARDVAPDEMKEPVTVIIDAFRAYAEAMKDPDTAKEAFGLILTDAVSDATNKVERYARDTCGFRLGSSTDVGGSSGSVPGGSGTGYSCSSIHSSFDSDKTDASSIYSIQSAICAANPDAAWMQTVVDDSAWSFDGSGWTITVFSDMASSPYSGADALATCRAVASYLATVGAGDQPIRIGTGSSDGQATTPKTTLVTKGATGECEAA